MLLYETAPGQKINFEKSAVVFGPGVRVDVKAELRELLGVTVVSFHEKYLGLPTVSGKNKKEMYKKLLERLDLHLSNWNNNFLSKAGKMVLVKAVTQSILNYTMSVFQLPKGVLKVFQSKVAKFWWGKEGGKRGIHWCKWS